MNISREEPSNSATHLPRRLCHHGDSWPAFTQSELALPRQVLSLGFLRQTSTRLWEQDMYCPPPTHPVGVGGTPCNAFPQCTLWRMIQIEGGEP